MTSIPQQLLKELNETWDVIRTDKQAYPSYNVHLAEAKGCLGDLQPIWALSHTVP